MRHPAPALGLALTLTVLSLAPLPAVAGGGLRIYADELDTSPGGRVTYGWDRNAVCPRGFCDNGTTVCTRDSVCAGIGDGLCHYTACASDFNLCDDGETRCADNADCAGIGSGTCNDNPCDPPDEQCGVTVDSLTPGAPAEQTIWQLVCDPATLPDGDDCQVGSSLPPTTVSWDFSGFNETDLPDVVETASSTSEITSADFAPGGDNSGDCGFDWGGGFPGRRLDREDADFTDSANFVPTLTSTERENDVGVCDDGSICVNDSPDCDTVPGDHLCKSTATIWLRGVVRYEGIEGADLGTGESRLCHTDDDGDSRTEVPLWRFPDYDGRYYMELGDPVWRHTPFACERAILAPTDLARIGTASGYVAIQSGEVVNEGVVELPSGHRFRALVARSVAEYRAAILGCAIGVSNVRTVLYLWEVPHLGTVVRLQSDKVALDVRFCDDGTTVCGSNPDCTGIGSGTCNTATPGEFVARHLSEVDVKYGPFPPLTLNVGPVTAGTIDVSWNPGAVANHIDGYRVYWGEESGGSCSIGGEDCNADHPGAGHCTAGQVCCGTPGAVCASYERDSVSDPGQIVFDGGCALAPGDTRCATIGGLDPGTTYYVTVTTTSSFTNPQSGAVTPYESALYPARIPAVPVDLPIEVGATTGGGATAGAVPDGGDRPGTPLSVARSGGDVSLSWGASCRPDTTYAVYEGPLGDWEGHESVTCDTLGATGWGPFTPQTGDRFFLIVPINGSVEGSYGLKSPDVERPAGQMPCETQSLAAPVCP